MKTIYLVRHGETVADSENRLSGDYETPLTKLGLNQAKKVAHNLFDSGIEIIFTSPQWRALQTAETIEKALSIHKEILPGLRARNRYGIMTGLSKQDAEKKYPFFYAALKDRYYADIPLAESYTEFSQRLQKTWDYILFTSPKTCVVVTHGAFFKWLTTEILHQPEYKELDRDGYFKLTIQNQKIITLEIKGVYAEKT